MHNSGTVVSQRVEYGDVERILRVDDLVYENVCSLDLYVVRQRRGPVGIVPLLTPVPILPRAAHV